MKGTYRRLALSVFLLLALCLPEVQAFSEAAPSDIVSWVSGHYEAQEIAAYAEDGSTCAIAVRNESAYTLVLLRREDGKLITDIENTKALKAGSAPLLSLKNSGNELSIAYEDRYNNEITSSVTYSASRASGGIWSVTDIKYRWNQELNEYNVMLGKGNIAIEYTLWDKDGSVLSKAAFPKLPAVWLSGYKALTDFNCALFAEAPLNSDIYAESALAPCILEFSDDIVSVEAASLGTTGVFSTCKMRDETRRAVIIEIGEGGGAVLTQSLPLPDAISLDTFHSWSSMQLYINGEGDSVGIRRQADGSWAVVNIMADEVIQLGANYIKLQGAENNRCLFGSSPWSDFRTLDFKTIPKSQAEAENAFETDGWAVVNNPSPDDRLNLRKRPDSASASLGKYYNGAPVRILEYGKVWCEVSVLDVKGYMMTKYLAFGDDIAKVNQAFPCLETLEKYMDSGAPIYAAAEDSSSPAFFGTANFLDWIIGVSDSYYHVFFADTGAHGYVKAVDLWNGNG